MMNKKKINVLLVSPGFFSPDVLSFGDNHLVALGSALQEWTDATVRIFDFDYEALLPKPDNSILLDTSFDLVGISCYSSYDYLKSFYMGVEIRKHNPSVCLVVGGYHASARPSDFTGEDSPFDHVVVGEGERPLTRIVKALEQGQKIEERVLGPELVEDLNQLPFPDWSLLDHYLPAAKTMGRVVTFNLSRGCVFTCSFCMEAAKGTRSWRPFTPERAEEELLRFHRWIDLTDRKLFLSDPLFGLNRNWRLEMLERFERMNLPIHCGWALSRADILEDDDLEYFQRARFGLGFGLESGDVDMLKIIHKGGQGEASEYLDRFKRLAVRSSEVGMPWGANIIVGHPGETAESMERSAKWMKELFFETSPLTGFLSIDPYRFYPGSPIDTNSSHYEETYGTKFYWPRWWDYSDPDFTSQWIDPSSSLDFRTRHRLSPELFLPVLDGIAQRFSYDGYAKDYFRGPTTNQQNYLLPQSRIGTIVQFYLWNQLTGLSADDARLDEEATTLVKAERSRSVNAIADKFGPLSDRLLDALMEVPRERFVNANYLWHSARDIALPLLEDKTSTLSAIHAYAVNYKLLDLEEGDRLLELGGGTGYGAAVASRIVSSTGKVHSVEIETKLADIAKENLKELDNVEFSGGDIDYREFLNDGYNKILFCYALDKLPDVADLLPLNSRLAAPVITSDGKQILTMIQKNSDGVVTTSQHGQVIYVGDKSE
jgi:protein-L-isoaspartate(D-aspartate) O-methyltransferase